MGTITNDMSRLRDEIDALRLTRETFMQGLSDGVEHMLAVFHGIRTKVARTSRADRRAFVSDLQDKVANLRHVAAAELKGAHVAFFGSHASRKPAAGSKRSKGKR